MQEKKAKSLFTDHSDGHTVNLDQNIRLSCLDEEYIEK
jgi:hypothetical protein